MQESARPMGQALLSLGGEELVEEATVGDVLRIAAAQTPASLALVEGGPPGAERREWTYAELLVEAEAVARAMLELVEPGDKVAIWANNVPEWILVQMGAALAGTTLVTLNPALAGGEAAYVLKNSGASVLFHVDDYRNTDVRQTVEDMSPEIPGLRARVSLSQWDQFVEQGNPQTALPEVTPDDIAMIQYTSGTTGVPKGAELRHRGIVNNSRLSFVHRLPMVKNASIVNPMPLFHTAGSVIMTLGAMQTGSSQVLMANFDPGLHLSLIESERSVVFGGVPTMFRALLGHPNFDRTDLSSVAVALSGGALVEAPLAREVETKVGVPLVITYGQTECSPTITMTHPEDSAEVRRTTLGRPLPGGEVKIVDPADPQRLVDFGEVGEVCTRGYHVMLGYHGDPVRTAETIDPDGWLHTGDLAYMDPAGNLTMVGRLKDMIIRGAENIYPSEIETALLDHEDLTEVAVIGLPSEYWGEEVCAYVKTRPDAQVTGEDLETFLAGRLAEHKIPRHWFFTSEFPMTASGKILKSEVRARATQSGATK